MADRPRIGALNAAELATFTSSHVTSFDEVRIMLGGSAAIDNVNFVPEPGTAGLVGLGLLGLIAAAHRVRF